MVAVVVVVVVVVCGGGDGAVVIAVAVPSSRILGSTAAPVPVPDPVSLVSGVVPVVESQLLSEDEDEDLEYAQGTISRRKVIGGSSGFISRGISMITHFLCIHTQKNP